MTASSSRSGAPLELYDRPGNLFVASFIGSPAMNFLRGELGGDGRPAFQRQRRHDAAARRGGRRRQRPAGGARHPAGASQLPTSGFPVEIVSSSRPARKSRSSRRTPGGEDIVAIFRERHASSRARRSGSPPSPASIHLFNGETGKRLVG